MDGELFFARHQPALTEVEVAQVEVARVRGWLGLGEPAKAEAALDRAMVALTKAESSGCPDWAEPLLERLHDELDEVLESQ